jgi:predicted anti-sigma-YlaC factor YlaD
VECDIAREALSARLDGEREPVPSARVDEHLASCPQCRAWYADAQGWTLQLRSMIGEPGRRLAEARSPGSPGAFGPPSRPQGLGYWLRWIGSHWARSALAVVGVIQIALAVSQIAGADFGMVAAHREHGAIHGAMSGAHLLNESTAWSLALGVGMVAAAVWRVTVPGVTCILAGFTVVLTCYEISDRLLEQVTGVRLLSHLPVLVGTVLALLLWRRGGPDTTSTKARMDDIVLPDNATRGRRRGHLRSADDSAA